MTATRALMGGILKQDAMLSQKGRTVRCHYKFWYILKFTAALHSFHCDSNAFKLNNSINHGKITVLNISIYCLSIHV